jgi:hypothetical protein
LKLKLDHPSYDLFFIKQLIGNTELAHSSMRNHIMEALDLKVKRIESSKGRYLLRTYPKDRRLTRTNLRHAFPRGQEGLLDRAFMKVITC